MPDPISAISSIVAVGGTLLQADAQRSATNKAAGQAQQAADKQSALTQENFNKAADISQRNLDQGLKLAEQKYNDGMSLFAPYLDAGSAGMRDFQALGGFYNASNGTVPATYQQYVSDFNASQAPLMAMPTAPVAPAPAPITMSQLPTNASKQQLQAAQKLRKTLNPTANAVELLKAQYGQNAAQTEYQQKLAEYQTQQAEYDRKMADYLAQKQLVEQQQAQRRNPLTQEQYYAQFAQQPAQGQIQPPLTQQQFVEQQQAEANKAQELSIDQIIKSPLYTELFRQGEDALLQNASATGGMRGGNTQGALAYYRPSVLKALIDQKTTNAQTITDLGIKAASAAAGLGSNYAGLQGQLLSNQSANMGNLLTGQTSAMNDIIGGNATVQGNAALAQGQTQANMFGGLAQGVGGLTTSLNGLINKGGLSIASSQRAPQQFTPGSTVSSYRLAGY